MSYDPFETLVAPARPRPELWRLGATIALVVVLFIALNLAYIGAMQQVMGADGWRTLGAELANGSSPRAVLVMLFNFATLCLSLAVAIFAFYGRGLLSLIGPLPRVFHDFKRVFAYLVVLNVVLWLLPWPAGIEPQMHLDLGTWLRWLPLALIAIGLQTTTEELAFRGFLQSQLAARVRSPLVWMVLPSVVFALLHYDAQVFGPNAALVALWAGMFALFSADITARAGNLGPALAMHLVNNVSAMLIYAVAGHWDGLALNTLPLDPADDQAFRAVMLLEGGAMLCSWLAARLAIRR